MNFYEVGGHLVRRAKRPRRGAGAEVWIGDGWVTYADLNELLRQGHRLTDADAIALLQVTRKRTNGLTPLSEEEARAALRTARKHH